ncbi:energy transducer TonB [Pseudomonas gingeri]|uniref:Energy transducer TonB n=1 Tax=Pseudomonas gingeri TaxID=117681 RepID=A0A7Y7X7G2_9PSED|nr:energy transducer TonB [Pseudomonas gingeri]NWA23622.1 energy transducer TonB [Pseudomonas gingeri]NWB94526.1 energy transducer TonB [Pseudomonas gingeri]NWD68278.1 energy transducer TonB [Pseudomonas gingeri]NWD77889.1 energy transducer TonB [Pseudomonas gingeri]
MSDIRTTSIGYLSPVDNYGLRNSQALSGVSHLWQDFFARALAEAGDSVDAKNVPEQLPVDGPVEPTAGAELLAQIVDQRQCDVKDTPVRPPEPLFLPIAEFDLDLLKRPVPYPPEEVVAQQKQQDFESGWVRPVVLNAGQPLPVPGPAPQTRPLHLPIAEFELDLLEPHVPFDEATLAKQQKDMDYDLNWARPLVAHNLRLAA